MSVQIRRILFPTDFDDPAAEARKYAIALTEQFDGELHLLHIVPYATIPLPEASTAWTLPATDERLQVKEAESQLRDEINPNWAAEHHVVEAAKVGNAVEEIVKYAKEQEIDLIVLGTHGHMGFAHLLMGSVAEKVVRLATCPVLTVHPSGHQFLCDKPHQQAASSLA